MSPASVRCELAPPLGRPSRERQQQPYGVIRHREGCIAVSPDEKRIRPVELTKLIPPGPRGKRRHVATIYRYIMKGVRGIRLEAEQLPDGLYTSVEAWHRFVQGLTVARFPGTIPPTGTANRAEGKKQWAVEAEIEAVRATLRRKGGR
jgi:hypothetical protein